MTLAGFPHSDISGSPRACRSPKLFAACYVLHRLSAPRHPPSTLSNLTIRALNSCDLCCPGPYRPETHIPLLFLASFTLPLSMIHTIAKINRERRRVLSPLFTVDMRVVGLDRFELSTPRLSSVCSNQLSYRPASISDDRGFD
jgi:hypothetical protein